jgi:acyl-CoA hydrolase
MALQPKRVQDSLTEQVQIVLYQHINGYNRLFGGQLIAWMDVLAAVVARRHSNCNVTTACIDQLKFKSPVYVNSTVLLRGRVTYVGHTSMEVQVDAYVEELDGHKELVNTAIFVMVALDEQERPTAVPGLILETEQEKKDWEAAKLRRANRNS